MIAVIVAEDHLLQHASNQMSECNLMMLTKLPAAEFIKKKKKRTLLKKLIAYHRGGQKMRQYINFMNAIFKR